MKDLVTIVVPIYSVENYLKNCVSSILEQTYINLEILLVDDGSTDNSGKICDELSKLDQRIRVIHKKNGGLSSARNIGINQATGKYITFLDSDDYINIHFIELLIGNMKNTNAMVSVCKILKVYDLNYDITKSVSNELTVFEGKEKYYNIYNNRALETVVAWNKLYDIRIFDHLRYPEGKIHEDEYVIHEILANAEKIVYTDAVMHYYFQRNNSIMKTYNLKRLDIIEGLKNRLHFFKEENYLDLYDIGKYYYTTILLCHYCNMIQLDMYEDVRTELKQEIKVLYQELVHSRYLSKDRKIKLIGVRFFPKISYFLFMKKQEKRK